MSSRHGDGRRFGDPLVQPRGFLNAGMIWTVAAVPVLVPIAFQPAVVIAEQRTLGGLAWTRSRVGK